MIAELAVVLAAGAVFGYAVKSIGAAKVLADIEAELKAVVAKGDSEVAALIAAVRKHL